ncbi:MAG: hypothetical protein ACWGSQ_19355 [Longimicrobiales bacterium]
MHPLRLLSTLVLAMLAVPGSARGQLLFDWPIRAVPQPEAILTGAGAVFWNPGGMSEGVRSGNEIWIAHVDGPDATGVRGLALAGTVNLPLRLIGGLGYWHLGIPDIPRTTDSPLVGSGTIEVAEDAMVFALTRDLEAPLGIGGGLRLHRASVAGEVKSQVEGDVGLHLRPPIALSPRFGLALRGLGKDPRILAGVEVGLPPLASSRIPVHLGYGVEKRPGQRGVEQRVSFRASWLERLRAGFGLTRWEREAGWTALWMLGLDFDRYSFSILRENLANGFGPVHFYRASIRLPESESR